MVFSGYSLGIIHLSRQERLFNLLKKRGNDAYADQLNNGPDFLE